MQGNYKNDSKLTRDQGESLAGNAYSRIKKHFSVDVMANKITLLYNQVLNTNRP